MSKNDNVSARAEILAAVKKNKPEFAPLPSIPEFPGNSDGMLETFKEALKKVGGEAIVVPPDFDINHELKLMYEGKTVICSNLPFINIATITATSIDTARGLEKIDLAILKGEFAVAENAAIWVPGSTLPHYAIPFITQHLVIIVNKNEMVSNMHQAYKKLTLETPGYGVFISGPSKTADIEQSLVIGAHGARSLRVFLME
ncbi:MAG TPA: LUD domain-containing protein [Cytophagaceae bacterium]